MCKLLFCRAKVSSRIYVPTPKTAPRRVSLKIYRFILTTFSWLIKDYKSCIHDRSVELSAVNRNNPSPA